MAAHLTHSLQLTLSGADLPENVMVGSYRRSRCISLELSSFLLVCLCAHFSDTVFVRTDTWQ